MLFLLWLGEFVALVLLSPKSPRGIVNLSRELLYTCKEIISEIVFFVYLIDESVTRKFLWIDLNSRPDIYIVVVYFDLCCTDGLD